MKSEKLTKSEARLIACLELSSSKSDKTLKQETGLSRRQKDLLVEDLKYRGIIEVAPFLDVAALGEVEYIILLRLNEQRKTARSKLFNFLLYSDQISWVASLDGKFSIAFCLRAHSMRGVRDYIENLMVGLKDSVTYKAISARYLFKYYGHRFLRRSRGNQSEFVFGETHRAFKLSEEQLKLYEHLKKIRNFDGPDLFRRCGIETRARFDRLCEQLFESGLIEGEGLIINHEKLGFAHFKLFIQTRGLGTWIDKRILPLAEEHPNIIYSAGLYGYFDYEFGICGASRSAATSVISDIKRTLKGKVEGMSLCRVLEYNLRENFTF